MTNLARLQASDMTDFLMFKRHLDAVHKAARVVIEKRNAKARWPTLTEEDKGADGKCIAFDKPAVLWDAPLRKSSKDSRIRRAIVIDGHFIFKDESLSSGGVHLELYSTTKKDGGFVDMKMLDTMHFDFEPQSPQTAFHPMFHVQFGKSKRIGAAMISEIVSQMGGIQAQKLSLDRTLDTPMRDIRIPTPQMDYMSVLAMVIADHFCDVEWSSDVHKGFINLLRQVMHANNPARTSHQSRRLESRWSPDLRAPFCASHWYEESHA